MMLDQGERIKEQGQRLKAQGTRKQLILNFEFLILNYRAKDQGIIIPLAFSPLIARCSVLAALPYQQNISCINTDVPCHNRTLGHEEKIEIYTPGVAERFVISLTL